MARSTPIPVASRHVGPGATGTDSVQGLVQFAPPYTKDITRPGWQALFDGVPDALFLVSLDGQMLDANAAAEALLGYRREELSGRPVSQFHPASETARIADAFDLLRTTGSARYDDGLIVACDGEIIPVNVSGARIRLDGSDHVIAVVRDIRARKQAEAEMQAAQERFYLLAEHIREIFWVSNPQTGRIHYASPAFSELTTLSGVPGQDDIAHWRTLIAPPDRPRFDAFLAAQSRGDNAQVEVRMAAPGGQLMWLHCRAFPWQPQGGRVRVAGVAEDITVRKQAEAHTLAQAERQSETLVREAHHRMKNSLQGVVGLLRRCAGQHPGLASALTGAISQVRSIAVIHELQGSHPGEPLVLGELLRMIAGSIEGLFQSSVQLEVNDRSGDTRILADAETVPLAIVLNELLMNAVKHHRGDDHDPEGIRIDLSLCGEGALIVIGNHGHLPDGFDFQARRHLGQGLELLAALLPPEHTELTYRQHADRVQAHLLLRPPIITL